MSTSQATLAEIQRAKRAGVLRALPRRPRLATTETGPAGIRMRPVTLPKSKPFSLFVRFSQWMVAVHLYVLGGIRDAIMRRNTLAQKGIRMRRLFERVGGTGVKIGQQLSVRVDYFPYEICAELSKLTDHVPPFPLSVALPRIEKAIGKPIREVFEYIDPNPIGSASLGCVFKGKLKSGEDVAVKVRRPGVERAFVEDLTIVGFLLRSIEFMTLVRPGFFAAFYTDLKSMLFEELDFVLEANYQSMYRKYIKKDKLKWVQAPKVFHHLSSQDVMISKFVTGFPCADLLKAVESNDPAALDKYRAANIDPEIIAGRILEVGFWSFYECPFFQGDPHPGNIILLPNNRICMLDFGACGISSLKQRAIGIEVTKRILEHDVGGVAGVAMAAMEPLPYVNTDDVKKAAKSAFMDRMIVLRTKDAGWWERTTAAIWLSLVDATRKFQVPINMDVLRMTRATLLYDTLAARLQPDIDILDEFKDWERAAVKRARRRRQREVEREADTRLARNISAMGELQGTIRRGLYWANEMTSKLPRQFMVASTAGAFIASSLLRLALVGSLLTTLAVAFVLFQSGFPDTADLILHAAADVIREPIVIGALSVVGFLALRSIQDRLKDRDQQD